jgi:hypothetical protein
MADIFGIMAQTPQRLTLYTPFAGSALKSAAIFTTLKNGSCVSGQLS